MAGSTDHRHLLGATVRCLCDDLDISPARSTLPIALLRDEHVVIADFIDKRTDSPEGSETIRALAPDLIAFSLHTGRYRSATWFQRGLGLVWLMATAIHRAGDRDDSYRHFVRLRESHALLPTRADVERVVAAQHRDFASGLITDVPPLLESARRTPNVIHEGVIGGRVRVRLAVDDGLMTVAICNRVLPGEVDLPREWLVQVLAAVFPEESMQALSFCDSICGSPLARDEPGFCYFAD